MPTLWLHIGDIKTGSTFLQATFRHGRASLQEAGIAYPIRARSDDAALGDVTKGNGDGMLDDASALAEALAHGRRAATEAGVEDVLYSGEFLGARLAHPDAPSLTEISRQAGFETVRLLFFLRDPTDHAMSIWNEAVKTGGYTGTIEDYFAKFERPIDVLRLLRKLESQEIYLTLHSYSRRRNGLVAAASGWLGLERPLEAPPVAAVNRGLDSGEAILQRRLNARLGGRCGGLVAVPLMRTLPAHGGSTPAPSHELQEAMIARLAPILAEIDARLEPEDRYGRDLRTPADASGAHPFTEAQLETIADGIAVAILRLRAERVSGTPTRILIAKILWRFAARLRWINRRR